MKSYLLLLATNRVVRTLSTIQLLSYFGAWFSNVAVYTLLIALNVDASVISITAAMHFLAGVFQAPFSGVIIDKIAPKRLLALLLGIEIITTLLLLTIGGIDDIYWLYLLIFIRMGAASFYFTAEMTLLPTILSGRELQTANEIHSIIWSFSYSVGMALSGVLVYNVGVKGAFLLDAALFCIALVLLLRLRMDIRKRTTVGKSFLTMFAETFAYVMRKRRVLALMLLHASVGVTAFDALVALIADRYYLSVVGASIAIGSIHAFRAIGLVVGPILFAKRINDRNLTYLFIFQAVSISIWAAVIEHFYLSLFVSIAVGLCTTTLWSYTYTMLQRETNREFYGRIIAYNDMLFLSVSVATSLLIGYLAKIGYDLHVITAILASAFLLTALYYKVWVEK